MNEEETKERAILRLSNALVSLETQLEFKDNEIKKLKDQLMRIKEIVI